MFSRHTAIRPSCVGATPVPKGFHHMSNFQFQFPIYKQGHTASLTHRVQRSYGLGWDIRADHPDVPAVGHDVLSLSKLFDDFQGIVLSYAWIIREIGVRYAFFSIYPFLRLLSNVWTKTAFLNYACKQHKQFRYPFGNEKTHRRDTVFQVCVCVWKPLSHTAYGIIWICRGPTGLIPGVGQRSSRCQIGYQEASPWWCVCHHTPYHTGWTSIADVSLSDSIFSVSNGSFADSSLIASVTIDLMSQRGHDTDSQQSALPGGPSLSLRHHSSRYGREKWSWWSETYLAGTFLWSGELVVVVWS